MTGEVEGHENLHQDLTRDDVGSELADVMGKVLESIESASVSFNQKDQIEVRNAVSQVKERVELMSGGIPSRTPQEVFVGFIEWLRPYPELTSELLKGSSNKAFELAEMVKRVGLTIEVHMREEKLLTQTARRQLRDLKKNQKT